MSWTKGFPKEVGNYWFYGYRYGKVSCGRVCEPEWLVVKARKCANGFMYTDSTGQFMFEEDVEEAHFMPLELPEFPEVNAELTPEQEAKILDIDKIF